MSKNNRFTSAGQASKNIIQPPSCVLHYYNVPLCVTEETFVKVSSVLAFHGAAFKNKELGRVTAEPLEETCSLKYIFMDMFNSGVTVSVLFIYNFNVRNKILKIKLRSLMGGVVLEEREKTQSQMHES